MAKKRKPDALVAKSIADQDQEWAEARAWCEDPANQDALLTLTVASVAEDAEALTRLMADDPRYAEVVQRIVALVIVEVSLRRMGH